MTLGILKSHSDLLWNLYFHSRNRAGAMLCPYRNVKSFPTSYWWKVFIQHLSDVMFCLCYLLSVMEDRQHLATCQESPMRSVLDWNSLLLLKAGHYAVKNTAEPACIWCQSILGGNNPFKSFFFYVLSKEWSQNIPNFRRILYIQNNIPSWTFHWWSWVFYIHSKCISFLMC